MNFFDKYADLVIKRGLNLYSGQSLNIETGVEDIPFAIKVAESAYRNGAKFVNVALNSNKLTKYRVDSSTLNDLDYSPEFQSVRMLEMIADDWATVRIDNTADADILKDADTDRLNVVVKNARRVRRKLLDACSKNRIAWCVIASPNQEWANKVMGQSDNSLAKFSSVFEKVLRLDNNDPLKAWDLHGDLLDKRADYLNSLRIKKVFINSSSADLEVSLTSNAVWTGGRSKTADGRVFWANLPTEELFTTPDFKGTKGKIKIVRPVQVMEKTVINPSFEFIDGKVISFDSESNRDVLEKYLNSDEGASYLGEIALVDTSSPIYKTGLTFNSILFDENASSHIAIGNGYGFCLSNGAELKNKEDYIRAGCNVSSVHTDFMFGTDDTEINVLCEDGSKVTVMKNGAFIK